MATPPSPAITGGRSIAGLKSGEHQGVPGGVPYPIPFCRGDAVLALLEVWTQSLGGASLSICLLCKVSGHCATLGLHLKLLAEHTIWVQNRNFSTVCQL